jgi:osmotically-inducible protein OsmY
MTQTIQKSDQELRTNVTDELTFNPSIDTANVGVAATDGVVTLSGDVGSLPERREATRATMRVLGVRGVTNDMAVRDPGTSGSSDAEIGDAANQMLMWAADVPPNTVKADVRDHMVTLSGTVNWQYQRQAAARAVMYMRGVTGVANDIFLTATAPSQGLQAEIQAAMLRNAQLDSRAITTEVKGTEVTLRGTVRSWAELRQAEHIAWSAPGVTSVKNGLAIAS